MNSVVAAAYVLGDLAGFVRASALPLVDARRSSTRMAHDGRRNDGGDVLGQLARRAVPFDRAADRTALFR